MHLADTTPFNEEVSITIGAWELQRDITYVLVFNPSLPRDNKYNQLHGDAFDAFIQGTPKVLRKGTIRFFEFIGQKYAELADNNLDNYLITCAYSNIVYAYDQCDGIMYPSVPRGGEGFNVVLKKNVIESGALCLKTVRMDKFVAKKQDNGNHDFLNIASMDASNILNDTIEWNNSWQHFA